MARKKNYEGGQANSLTQIFGGMFPGMSEEEIE